MVVQRVKPVRSTAGGSGARPAPFSFPFSNHTPGFVRRIDGCNGFTLSASKPAREFSRAGFLSMMAFRGASRCEPGIIHARPVCAR